MRGPDQCVSNRNLDPLMGYTMYRVVLVTAMLPVGTKKQT